MEPLPAVLIVVVVVAAALGGARWLADLLERSALVATGPVAGEPALARAAAATIPVRTGRGPGARASGVLRPAAGPGAVGTAAAALGGTLAWTVGAAPELPALTMLAGLGLVLAGVDVRAHRLPDALVLPAYPLLTVLLGVAALTGGDPPAGAATSGAATAAGGGAAAFGVLYVLAVAVPAGFGYGDVKLGGLLGAGLGWYGWSPVVAGLFCGFVYGGLCAGAMLVARRLARTDRVAFGPYLLAGALTAVVVR